MVISGGRRLRTELYNLVVQAGEMLAGVKDLADDGIVKQNLNDDIASCDGELDKAR